MAAKIPDIRQGDTYRLELSFPNKDVTGWEFQFTLKNAIADVTPALQVTTTAGDHADDQPVYGTVFVELTATQTAALTPGMYYYDLQRTIPGATADVLTLLPTADKAGEKLRVIEDVSA